MGFSGVVVGGGVCVNHNSVEQVSDRSFPVSVGAVLVASGLVERQGDAVAACEVRKERVKIGVE